MYKEIRHNYPALSKAAEIMPPPPADILGRDLNELRRGLRNPEKANVALLAEPGTGKTAYVQGFAYDKESLPYYLTLEVNPERLIEKDGDRENALLVGFNELLDQAGQYSKDNNVIVVLFVDEFHKVIQISASLTESLKPRLEKSALYGFRLIAATTFQEYNDNVAPNRALDQRFLQIKLSELPKEAVIHVLENRAKQHDVIQYLDKGVLEDIYVESKRLLMSNAQPRASIDILNSMIGDTVKSEKMVNGKLVKEFFTPAELGFNTEKVICRPLLKRIIRRSFGVDIDNAVDAKEVIHALRTRLFNQDNATEIVVHLLEMAAQGFSDITRPKFSFLSTGSTGVGKSIPDTWDVPAPVSGGYVKNGDLKPGDFVYNRVGKPVRVDSIHPQGLRTVYRITLADGRQINCARDHLWTYKNRVGNGSKTWKTVTTEELMKKQLARPCAGGRVAYGYVIPQNEAVERDAINYKLDPYAMGAVIGNGILGTYGFEFSSDDRETVAQLETIFGLPAKKKKTGYTWYFVVSENEKNDKLLQTRDILQEVPELIGKKSGEKFIPDIYKFGSIEQRWALIQGLFDTDGTIQGSSRFNVSYSTTSERLAHDVQEVLWSLGIMSSIKPHSNKRDWNESETFDYHVHVKVQNKDKAKFFRLPRKLERAMKAREVVKAREKKFDTVAIKSIEKLDYKEPMTCIMVDDPEHLYLAGREHIVTHNTELAKIISETMMIPLKRFDMSRYGDPAMAKEFADALFHAAWSTPNAYILIDEVEKSSKRAMNILLQVLDDARLTDSVNPDRVASFTGCIINLTTNVGSEIYQNMQKFQDASAEADKELVYKALVNAQDSDGKPLFETAVLGRVDEIVPFHPLPLDAMMKIADRTLKESIEIAQTHKRRILVSDDIIPYIVKDRTSNDTERGGARDAKRNVRSLVVQELAHYMTYAKEEVPVIIYLKGEVRFKHEYIADPLNAQVAIMECHPANSGDILLKRLSEQIHKPLINKGLYFPKNRPLNDYAKELIDLISAGYFQFYTQVDDETVTIKGV
jgi:hypothetical protein